jgi:bile acid:Na+ symporter, BASS family
MEIERLVNILVPVTLIEMMIAIGLGVMIRDVLAVARDWRLLLRAAAANYVLVPAVTVGLLLLFRSNPMPAAGFLILAACPGAPYGPPATAIARGNVTASVGLMVLLAGSSAVVAPVILRLLMPLVAGDVQTTVNAGKIIVTLLVTQLVPLCVGLALRHFYPETSAKLEKPAKRLSTVLNLALICLILIAQYRMLLEIQFRGLIGMLVLLVATLAIGWLLGSRDVEDRKTMMLTTALRNVGVGLVIANGAFAGTPALTAVLAYGLIEVGGSLLVAFFSRSASGGNLALAGA